MEIGPVEVMVVAFPGSQFNGEIAPALAEAVSEGNIRVLDLVFITRPNEDEIEVVELDDLGDAVVAAIPFDLDEVDGLLSEDDLDFIADVLDVGSSAVAIVFEHTWAARLSTAVRGSMGQVVMNERIPADVVAAALAEDD